MEDGVKITELNMASSITDYDIVPVVNNNETKKVNIPTMIKYFNKHKTYEMVCGQWIDGKPIYRQVFENEGTMVVNQWGRGIPGNVYNIDTLVNAYFIDKPSKAVWNDTNVKIEDDTIKYFSANWTHAYTHIVIEYTKTTD